MTSANQHLKKAAHSRVHCAYVFGELARFKECARCGAKASDRTIYAHHDDYAKPMDVIPLCGPCHVWRHEQLKTEKIVPRGQLRREYAKEDRVTSQYPIDLIDPAEFVIAFERLTPRQREVLELIAFDGLENEEMAAQLFLAPSTVELHRVDGCRALAQHLRVQRMPLRLFTSLWWKHVRK